ncbi:hypothetical protein [Streptomyces brevispora]|uniref:hypothetical protein n=1 Tax=Streptomyces brevispora TaxID=887462 RepID=UPI001ABFD136|nr:hypothetical protein [Streptomyces brevispora]
METTSPRAQLAPEQIRRAADYVELVWQEQDSEEEQAALAQFHADGPELAWLIGEFDAPAGRPPHRRDWPSTPTAAPGTSWTSWRRW